MVAGPGNTAETSGESYVTRREAAKILRCSRWKLGDYEDAGRLQREKIDGRWHYRMDEVEAIRVELDERREDSDTRLDPPSVTADVAMLPRDEPHAAVIRAAAIATGGAYAAYRDIVKFYSDAYKDAMRRVRELEADRAESIRREEAYATRAHERALEVEIVRGAMTGSSEGEQVLSTVAPLVPAIASRILGIQIDTSDALGKQLKAFVESLSDEQMDRITEVLEPAQRNALAELVRLVRQRTEKKASSSSKKSATASG